MVRLKMKNYNIILTYYIYSIFYYIELAKISALSSGKIDEHEYPTVEEILPSNGRKIIEKATFTYFPLGKALEKTSKKQFGALKTLYPSNKKDELK